MVRIDLFWHGWATVVLVLATAHLHIAWAQSDVLVDVQSNSAAAVVYADSIRLGPVNSGPYWVAADTRFIRLLPVLLDGWSVSPLRQVLDAAPGDTARFTMDFPFYHRLDSDPFGAQAFLEDGATRQLLGTTPIVYETNNPAPGLFAVVLDGYEPVLISPRNEVWNRYQIKLEALDADLSPDQDWNVTKRRRSWIDYASATVGLAAGVMAVHYKFKADRLDDTYRETGDPALRPRIARLDDYSGVALGVMQVNVGVLAIRFALR